MFATEVTVGSWTLGSCAGFVVALFLVVEIVLRVVGFGDPVLYVEDSAIGYYPAPNQEIFRLLAKAMGYEEPELYESDESVINHLLKGTSFKHGFEKLNEEDAWKRNAWMGSR